MTDISKNAELQQSCITAVKSRFFAQYWEQDIIHVNMVEWGDRTRVVDSITMESDSFKKFSLKLKSIKNISDKDAIKVAELILNIELNKQIPIKIINEMNLDQCRVYNSTSFTTLYSDFYCKPMAVDSAREMPTSVCDYLRSKGYAVPFMEYSVDDLISFGWVQLF